MGWRAADLSPAGAPSLDDPEPSGAGGVAAVAAPGPDSHAGPVERVLADRLHVRPAGQRPPLAHPRRRRRPLQAVRRPAGGTSITGARLALFLDELGKAAAHPKAVVCDNGPELTSKAMRFWSERSGAALNFIQPGKPTQNAFVEGFDGKFRDSCLNRHWFKGLADVRRIVDDWRHHYNHERPHSSLGYPTPAERAKEAA